MAAVLKKPRLDEVLPASALVVSSFNETIRSLTFTRLLTEILLIILEMVEDNIDRFNLLRVCQHWNKTLRQDVYSKLALKITELPRFLAAVQKNPHLGASVHEISVLTPRLDENSPEPYPDFRLFKNPSPIARKHRVAWLWGTPKIQDVLLHPEDEETWMGKLLPYLVNVRKLHMRYTGYDAQRGALAASRIAILKRKLDDIPLSLQRLTECSITGGPRPSQSTTLYPFLHLPEMRVFRASRVYDFEQKKPSPVLWWLLRALKPRPWSSGVCELHFEDMCCSTRGFSDFITSCEKLGVFEYQHTRYITLGNLGLSFHARPFRNALFWHRKTLRVLRLNDKGETEIDHWRFDSHRACWFGSLREFETLQELWMPLRSLLDFKGADSMKKSPVEFTDLLPPSLRYFFVADMCKADIALITDSVISMLGERKFCFPDLKNIVLQFAFSWMDDGVMLTADQILETHLHGIRKKAKELGIGVEVQLKTPAKK